MRLWRCESATRTFAPVAALPVPGFVNGLAFSRSGRFLMAGVGQEHRLGRWFKAKAPARNGVCFLPLPQSS